MVRQAARLTTLQDILTPCLRRVPLVCGRDRVLSIADHRPVVPFPAGGQGRRNSSHFPKLNGRETAVVWHPQAGC